MNSEKSDFFSFGNNLLNGKKRKSDVVVSVDDVNGKGLYTCAVCGVKSDNPVCTKCGFDNSRNYEQYSTLQEIKADTPSVSLFKLLWDPPAEPSVEQSMALLRNQKWDKKVLSAVEKILSGAKDGGVIEPPHIEVNDTENDKHSDKRIRHCSLCGTSNSAKNLYCLSCGAKLRTKVNG